MLIQKADNKINATKINSKRLFAPKWRYGKIILTRRYISYQESKISNKHTKETYRGLRGSGIDEKILLSVGSGLIG